MAQYSKGFMMKKILLFMLLFFVAVYFVLTHYFANVEINKYDSLETVKKQHAMQNGWIPKNLPLSAYDIAETHEANSNTIVGKFSYKERDEAKFLEGLKESNEIYKSEAFLFKVDKALNLVHFRNMPLNKK